jgi:hypothetical protein
MRIALVKEKTWIDRSHEEFERTDPVLMRLCSGVRMGRRRPIYMGEMFEMILCATRYVISVSQFCRRIHDMSLKNLSAYIDSLGGLINTCLEEIFSRQAYFTNAEKF